MKFDVAMDACVNVTLIGEECGSKVDPTGTLPVQILQGTFSFGDICKRR
jgi:hypothetical protein